MKKKLTLLLVFFININYICFSQPGDGNKKGLESIQNAYFNKELGLSADEERSFWPVYNAYKSEIRGVRQERSGDQIAFEEKVLNIRKKYRNDFKRILGSDDRVNKVFVTEISFREILRKELIDRRIRRDGNDQDL